MTTIEETTPRTVRHSTSAEVLAELGVDPDQD